MNPPNSGWEFPDFLLRRSSLVALNSQHWVQGGSPQALLATSRASKLNAYVATALTGAQASKLNAYVVVGVGPLVPSAQAFPVPKGPLYPVSLRTWTDPLKLELNGKDQFYGVGGPDYDWPNPKGPRFPIDLRTWAQSTPLNLLGKDALPFRQRDWPNPRGAARSVDLLAWSQAGALELLLPTPAPFAQTDWPKPLGPQRLRQDSAAASALVLAAPPSPFAQTDWANPQGPAYAVALRAWLQNGIAGGPLAVPFTQGDWPNPTRAPRTEQGWAATLAIALNLFGDAPFHQTEWPNPKGYRRGDATLTVQPALSLGGAAQLVSKLNAYGLTDLSAEQVSKLNAYGLTDLLDAQVSKLNAYVVLTLGGDAELVSKLNAYAVLAPQTDLYLDAFSLMRALDEDAAGRMSGATLDGTGAMSGTLDLFARL